MLIADGLETWNEVSKFCYDRRGLLVYHRLADGRPAGRHAPHVTLSRRSLFCTNQTQVLFKTFFYAQKYDDWWSFRIHLTIFWNLGPLMGQRDGHAQRACRTLASEHRTSQPQTAYPHRIPRRSLLLNESDPSSLENFYLRAKLCWPRMVSKLETKFQNFVTTAGVS